MDFGCGGGSAGGSGGDDSGQGSDGSGGLKQKWSDLEASMKAVKDKDSVVKENAEQSAKIRRLMEDNILLEENVLRLETPSAFQEPIRTMPRPNPFVVMPAEVWRMIIEKMSRASDLEMLCLAFPQLEPLVKKTKKTIFLFENVFPFVSEHLKLEEINNCRLVCEKWNRDLCTLMANWNSPNLLSGMPVPEYAPPYTLEAVYDFQNHTKIQMFLLKMADYPGNPFFGRFLRLTLDYQTELEEFWKSALELVKKFGEHVWNLEIDCYRDRADPIAFYQALQETLIYLPNLRYFTVFVDNDLTGHGPSETDMAAQIGSSPFPALPYLQSFKLLLEGETGMISAFSSLFSQQIQRLDLLGKTFGSVDLKDDRLRALINLDHLEVEFKSTEDILRLLKFPCQNLRKLGLDTENVFRSGPSVSVTSGQVGNLLGKFTRLEYLDLIVCRVESNSSKSSKMRFLRLTTLKIVVGVDEDDLKHNLDFVLWFPSLKHLVIMKDHTTKTNLNVDQMDKHSTLKIRNCLYTGQILDSNIWTLIPSLKVLEINSWRGTGDGKYTREMFENRRG